MSDDHCIITKYELSTREKQLKNSFFKPTSGNAKNQTTEESKVNLHLSNNLSLRTNPQMEEIMSKALNDEINKKKLANLNQINPTNQGNIPMNLIYNQNKILERNVDILHETQKSIHDLLVYNIKANNLQSNGIHNNQSSTNKLKEELLAENKKLLQEFIAPLYENLNILKSNFNNLMKDSNPNSELNSRVQDMIDKHNDFKEINSNIRKTQNTINLVEKNRNFQNMSKDNQVFKAIDDIKTSVIEITSNMGKLESDMNDNMKRMVENLEKKNLMNIINSVGNKNETRKIGINNNNNGPLQQFEKKNNLEEFNYQDFKNDMVDILNEKDKLYNQFLSTKFEIPKTKPTEKINFSYKVDHDDQKETEQHSKSLSKSKEPHNNYMKNPKKYGHKVNDRNYSQNNIANKELNNLYPKKEKNVFLDNYMSYSPQDQNIKNQANHNISSVNVAEESKTNNYNIAGTGTGRVEFNNMRSGELKDINYKNVNSSMKSNLSNFDLNDPKRKTSNFAVNQINVNENNMSTKNTINSTPTTNKNLVSSTKLQNINKSMNNNYCCNISNKDNKLSIINEDNHLSTNKNVDLDLNNPINKTLKLAEEEVKILSSNANRNAIIEVEVTNKEREKTKILNDIILKLCVERLMKEKKQDVIKEVNLFKEEKVQPTDKALFPFKYHENQIYSISENIIRDKILMLLKGKDKNIENQTKKIDSIQDNKFNQTIAHNPISFEISNKPLTNIQNLKENETINQNYLKLQEEISRRDNELDSKMKLLYEKLESIDVKMKENMEKNELKESVVNNNPPNMNVEDIISKLKNDIKENMHININVQQPQIYEKKELIIKPNPSLVLENFDLEIEKKYNKKPDSPSKRSIISNYSHPFARSTNRKDFAVNNFELANPYYYNLDEYDVSSESLVSSSKRNDTEKSQNINLVSQNNQNYNNISYITEQTISEGQIPNTKRTINKDINLQQSESSSRHQPTQTEESSSENDEQKRYYFTVSNLLKQLNPKNDDQMNELKKLNLYDSDEHKKFQSEFLQRMQESQFSNNTSNNFTSQRNNNLYASFGNNAFVNFTNSPQVNIESNRSNGFNNSGPIYKLPKLNSDIEVILKKSNEKQNNIHTITEGESESNVSNNNDPSLSSISQRNK